MVDKQWAGDEEEHLINRKDKVHLTLNMLGHEGQPPAPPAPPSFQPSPRARAQQDEAQREARRQNLRAEGRGREAHKEVWRARAAQQTPGDASSGVDTPRSDSRSSNTSRRRSSFFRPMFPSAQEDIWRQSQDALKSKLPACLRPEEPYMKAKSQRIKALAESGQIFECLGNRPFLNGVFALLMRTVLYVIVVATLALLTTLVVHVFVSDDEPGSGALSDRDQTINDLTNRMHSPHALTAVSTAVAFLVVTRLQTNVAQNREIYELFFAICGTTCAIAIECRAFAPYVNSRKSTRCNVCSKISRVLAAIPYALVDKFRYGDTYEVTKNLWTQAYAGKKLPLFDDIVYNGGEERSTVRDPPLLWDCKRVQQLNLPMYESLILLLTYYVDSMETEGVAAPKVGFLAGNIRALTSDEGKITGMTSFQRPTAVTTLMYFVLFMWYVLLLLTDLVPNNKWHSVYLMSVIGLSTIGFYGLAEEIKNPFGITTLGIPGVTCLSKRVAGPSSINQQRQIALECSKTEGVVMTILGEDIFFQNKPTLYPRLALLEDDEPCDEYGIPHRFGGSPIAPATTVPSPRPMAPFRGLSRRASVVPRRPPSAPPGAAGDESEDDPNLIISGGLLLSSDWCTGGSRRRRLPAVRA